MKVQIFSDVACPWCYIGWRRFQTALQGFEHRDQLDLTFGSYQLDPSLPEHDHRSEADYLSEVKGLPRDQVAQMLAHVTAQAKDEGLDYDFDALVVANSWSAHRLIQRAKAVSPEAVAQVEERLFAAHFERGENIADTGVLTRIGVESGLSEEQATEALTDPIWEEAIRADLAQARAYGVTGVPFFVIDERYGLSGAQPPATFLQALTQAYDEHQQRTPLTRLDSQGSTSDSADDATLQGQACGPEGCD
ncbi:MAG: DsbA family oxidoreductase [Micrococcaceae bacterium]